ncbi:MAG: hypothetical protein A3C47_02785 [Omnitrophica bacterium RIFCSPHIGHO2_02_FULL_51_18]|nr:MAG: hypothetical protein A3C47_02785 [Omnitrophica bacterium RIFCSPHIGHO2_02_FULL_51_18]
MKKPGVVLVLILLMAAFIALLTPKVIRNIKLKARSQNLTEETQRLKRENQSFENELRLLREDPVYLEKVAREKFNKAKQGEIVYKVVKE